MSKRKKNRRTGIIEWVKPKIQSVVREIAIAVIIAGLVSGWLLPWIEQVTSEEKPIREIIEQEAKLALEGRVDEVVLLFDEKAFVRDACGGNNDQEIIWNGKDRITERYRNLPNFTCLKHDAVEITISSDRTYARAIADTIGIYAVGGQNVTITSNQGEKWTFEKISGEWKIASFTYNLP